MKILAQEIPRLLSFLKRRNFLVPGLLSAARAIPLGRDAILDAHFEALLGVTV
jgi:hypothetical protein